MDILAAATQVIIDSSKLDIIGFFAMRACCFVVCAEMYLRNEARWPTAFILVGIFDAAFAIWELVMVPDYNMVGFLATWAWVSVLVIPPLIFMYRRRAALHQATEAVKQDQARYDDAWWPVKAGQEDALRKLAKVVSQHQ